MMQPPKISIITPSYNQAGFLEQTLRSVLDQDYPNLEYIVIDGASSDGSVDIIERYANRLAHWESVPDGGQSEAINKGFSRATGDILCWLNSDDLLSDGALATVAGHFSQLDGPAWLTGAAVMIDTDGRRTGLRLPGTFSEERFVCWGMDWVLQQATFWNRALWQRVGPLREDLHYVMDLDLWRRMFRVVAPHTTQQALACYRLHDTGKCVHMPEQAAAELRQLMREWLLQECRIEQADTEQRVARVLDDLLRDCMTMREAGLRAQNSLQRVRNHIVLGRLMRAWRRFVNPNLDL